MTLQEALYNIKTRYITDQSTNLDILINDCHKAVPEFAVRSRFDWQTYVKGVAGQEGWEVLRQTQRAAQASVNSGVPQGVKSNIAQVELKDNPLVPPEPEPIIATKEDLEIKLDKAVIDTGFPRIDELFRAWLKVRALSVASMMNNILEAQKELQGWGMKAYCNNCNIVIRIDNLSMEPNETKSCKCGAVRITLERGVKHSWMERSRIIGMIERCQKQIEAAVGKRFDGGKVELSS